MADKPAELPSTVVPSLAQANREPGRGTIFVVVSLLNLVMRPLTRRDWRGQDKIPQTGGVIFVANHISNADPLALGQFLAFSGRWPRFLAKASLFRYPVLGHILRACGQIPVQRQSAQSADALLAAVEAVGQGRAVVIYPEGTITRDPDLWPMEGKTGAARIALRTGCPIIPIGQWGAQELMYGVEIRFPRLLPRKTLRLVAGDPVPLDDLREAPVNGAVLDAATTRIMDAITALVAEFRPEPPPAERFDPQRPASAHEDEP
jgi:1-acyl-sn-glycerol-3-phosphate acyltransferase